MADFDPTIPSVARVYDHFPGGKDNFAADRELGERLVSLVPSTPVTLSDAACPAGAEVVGVAWYLL